MTISYKAKDVIREVDNGSTGELDRMVFKNHHTPEDFNDGDIQERIDQFNYYHLVEIDLHKIDRDEFYIDEELVEDYVEKIKNEGIENMPPMLISDNYEMIDGIHRLNALLDSGFDSFLSYVGSKVSLKEMLKNENKKRRKLR